jgi:phosphatidylglycerophosphate synthase
MLDGLARRLLDPALDRTGRALAARGVPADALTFAGLACGLAAAFAIALGWDGLALAALALNRLLDGLDGAVARATTRTDRGGFLDIVLDFVTYGAVPLAFALRDPAANALAAAVLLFTFYVNGASFLAFAAVAAKRGLESTVRGVKSIYFTAGLAEGTETVIAFAAMILWPQHFPVIALAFAGFTLMGAVARVTLAWHVFRDETMDEEGR